MALRIGLISDTHIPEARAALWPQIAGAFADVDMIFHGGDIHEFRVLDELAPAGTGRTAPADGPPSPRTLA